MEREDTREPVHSMRFCVLTLFPEMIRNAVSYSVLGRAAAAGVISVEAVDIREYSRDKHKHVDDYPFGGGAGMVMQPQPIYDAYEDARRGFAKPPKVVYLSPQGRVLNQEIARELAQEEGIILLCGHYEGVDQRVLDEIVTDEISIGDFVLTGGELPALVLIDAVARMVDGVLGNESSAGEESFSGMFLEYPPVSYTHLLLFKNAFSTLDKVHNVNIILYLVKLRFHRGKFRRIIGIIAQQPT